ncbi:MAG: TaqI-like C-terminal specificity domain-containing protein [Flavobacteriaceae bacterium]|nr:TaqI-like C-terminal specificity domain-containing protein [Flavobacteriaceae bacterium]MDZ4146742.1 TaqI-like C-terminal specificity domain-containing protein [Flavobacteriaceae bacterium]
MGLFQKSVEKKYVKELDANLIDTKYKAFQSYFGNSEIQDNIRNAKEEQFQEGFLRELFVSVLGYTLNPQPNFNLTTELKNIANSKKADGAILKEADAIGVIELKSTNTTDLDTVESQAFGYKNHHPKCVYVITSNFEKLRFYIQNAVDHIDFDLFNLTREQFSLMWICLAKDNLMNGLPLKIKESSVLQEENITKKLYSDYTAFREDVFRNLVSKNPQTDKLLLFNKTQKLLDRFLFIFFAEDRLLLPPNSISEIVKQWTTLKEELDEYVPLYDRFKKYFGYMNTGYKGKKHEIYAYNGGLFAPDEVLDNIAIDDDILYKHTQKLSQYDFETDVDVNILGHIFEHSLSEIENVQAEIKGGKIDSPKNLIERQAGKRKKDGIFYTPKYITKYITEQTIGKLCKEKRAELGIVDEEYAKGRRNRKKDTVKILDDKLNTYRDWLLNLSILDPACGSGAFLNQALDFLITEHHKIDDLRAQLLGGDIVFSDISTDILEKNIFGVDLNKESVEIAKLSLWLRTAQKGRKLNKLNNNIKCGNSLVDDPKTASEKAFDWYKEFPGIFEEKNKKAWHITTATHNSRYSQRMFDNHVKWGKPVWLSEREEVIVTAVISEIVEKDKLNILAYNICGDHLHMLLVCEEEEVPGIVGKMKAMSSRACNIEMGRTIPGTSYVAGEIPATASSTRGKSQSQLWTQKFGCKEITSEEQLHNTINYIQRNRRKHELPVNKGLQPLIRKITCNYEHAFRAEYKGGFDVVVGNPPYVRAELLGDSRDYLARNYKVFNPAGDLFSYFYEKSFQLLKPKTGIFGFISNTFDKTTAGISIREYLQQEVSFLKYIDFTEVQIFEGATTYPVILIARNTKAVQDVFDYIKIPKTSQATVIDIDFHASVQVSQNKLDKENWSFKNDQAVGLVDKLKKHKTIGEIYGKCYYGVKTALNEAFIIPNTHQTGSHVKPIFEGKGLKKWVLPASTQQLILFESRWTKKTYGEHIGESEALERLKNDFPELIAYILPHQERAKQRYDKGDFFWELRNCAYYDLFEKPKIVFPNLQNTNKFAFDDSGAYINAPAVILPTGDVFLTAVLNSKLVWYFLSNICVVRNGGYIEVKPQYFEQIPVPDVSEKDKATLEKLTRQVVLGTSEIREIQNKFIRLLQSKFTGIKITKKLENWYDLSFADFKKELGKQAFKPSLSEESEWIEFFSQQADDYRSRANAIGLLETEIDQSVYKLYGLTGGEIQIVEDSGDSMPAMRTKDYLEYEDS